jgi:outer membrane protein assembly factor BamB
VFATSIEGDLKERCLVHAFDVLEGRKLWTGELRASQQREYGYTVSRAAPSPAVDAHGVYVFFESGDVAMFSHEGQLKWDRSLVNEYGEFRSGHGIGSSVAQTDKAIVVHVAHDGPSYLLAIEKSNGRTLWKVDRQSRVSWTSPMAVSFAGKSLIVISSNGSVQGYDAGDGRLLWTLDGITGNTLPSVSVAGNRLMVGAGEARGNSSVTQIGNSNCCLQLTHNEGVFGCEVAWSAGHATASYATPIAHRGCAYFVNKVGVIYCFDLATGKQHYAKRIDGPCWASPIGVQDHVYFFTKTGATTVIKAGPEFHKVASNRLWHDDVDLRDSAGLRRSGSEEGVQANNESGSSTSAATPDPEYLDPIVYAAVATSTGFFVRTGTRLFCLRESPANSE